jgi:hypothetical protein
MKFLALEQEVPGRTDEDYRPHLKAESLRLWELVQAGLVRETYFRSDRHTAVLVLECEDATRAHAALDSLPLVRSGLIVFELVPLVPYDGFARLFA